MKGKEPTKNIYIWVQETEKKCFHGSTSCQILAKTNQLESVQGYGMQRTHKNVYV